MRDEFSLYRHVSDYFTLHRNDIATRDLLLSTYGLFFFTIILTLITSIQVLSHRIRDEKKFCSVK